MALRIPEESIDWRTKGLWLPGARLPAAEFVAAGYDIFTGPFSWPLLVLDRDAVAHNVATMADYTARHGLGFAPHGKTTMAPRLFEQQLDAGAWGITLAAASQVLTARGFGVPRIFLANELLDPLALRWVIAERERDPEFEFLFYVDSAAGLDAISAALAEVTGDRPLEVVIELGHAHGRTGVRTVAEIVELARAAAEVPRLAVAGVAGYEGGLPTVAEARGFLGTLREAAEALVAFDLVRPGPVVVSAGGSAYFDAVTEVLAGDWLAKRELLVLLRSGSYITHDDGFYREMTPFNRIGAEGSLIPALTVWAQVTSTPEPGLALVAMGKRDAPYDEGLPVPKTLRRADGATESAAGFSVLRFNDQHAYLDTSGGPSPRPGDLIAFGISHPCTAFDKWRVVPMLDADHRVVDLIHTYF
ncbi:alanine racemase [Actinocatenispora sera]|uniref:Amino acid deaminase n=1 Tax=Actinocatenispora sera TaxID=390989 RepID=A0A810KXL4_9ACTN|nr:alanine racemase [Actinocatenispora sera]BCJ27425.1 amino acid deaminase [Actinocatenispora sera]